LQYISRTCFEGVLAEWAFRENSVKALLIRSREPIISSLPKDTIWFKVRIDKQDLPLLRLIRDTSWNVLSFFAGEIPLAVSNFKSFTRYPLTLPYVILNNGQTSQQYFNSLMHSLPSFMNIAGSASLNLTLILVSSNTGGPFTILEGNHTAMALYYEYFVKNPHLQYPAHFAYVGISPNMCHCRFHHLEL
jgi:hypothetical protein